MLKKSMQKGSSTRAALQELQNVAVTKTIQAIDPLDTGMGVTYQHTAIADLTALNALIGNGAAEGDWARLVDGTSYKLHMNDNNDFIWLCYGKRDLSLLPYIVGTNKEDVIELLDSVDGKYQPAFLYFPCRANDTYLNMPTLADGYTVELRSPRYAEQFFVGIFGGGSGDAVKVSERFPEFNMLTEQSKGVLTGPGRFPVKVQFNGATISSPNDSGAWSIVQAESFFQSAEHLEWPSSQLNQGVVTYTKWDLPVAGWATQPSEDGRRSSLHPVVYDCLMGNTVNMPVSVMFEPSVWGMFVAPDTGACTLRLPSIGDYDGIQAGMSIFVQLNKAGGALFSAFNSNGIYAYDKVGDAPITTMTAAFKQGPGMLEFKLGPDNYWYLVSGHDYLADW